MADLDARDVKAGMQFQYQGVTVRVLRDPEPYEEPRFGMKLIRFWATREDTGAEGWMQFGPTALINTAD
jgi:hypothetical protein